MRGAHYYPPHRRKQATGIGHGKLPTNHAKTRAAAMVKPQVKVTITPKRDTLESVMRDIERYYGPQSW